MGPRHQPAYRTPAPHEFNSVLLPAGLSSRAVCQAIATLQEHWFLLDATTRSIADLSLGTWLGGDECAAVSQLVSRRIVHRLGQGPAYRRGLPQKFPDLLHRGRARVALEVKAGQYGRAVQAHTQNSGWYLVVRFVLNDSEIPEVVQILIGHLAADRLRLNPGSARRTGTATLRLRDLSVWYQAPRDGGGCVETRRRERSRRNKVIV